MSPGKRLEREAEVASARGDHAYAAVLYARASRSYADAAVKWSRVANVMFAVALIAFIASVVFRIVGV